MTAQTTRRGFLKFLGKGSVAAGTLAVPGAAIAAAGTEDALAYRFECRCGSVVVAKVPSLAGVIVTAECANQHRYSLTWHGDHFTVNEAA